MTADTPSEDVMKLAREMREGLEGVSAGPWACFYKSKYREWHVAVSIAGSTMKQALFADGCPTGERDAAHIARCSPDNIRSLLDHIDALTTDRAASAARIERLEKALRDAFCPRPCNGRPDDFEVGQCVDADECGCSLGHPLLTPAMLEARALASRKEGTE